MFSGVVELLALEGSDSLASVANWADGAVHTKEWAFTAPLHFANIQDTECVTDDGYRFGTNHIFETDTDKAG